MGLSSPQALSARAIAKVCYVLVNPIGAAPRFAYAACSEGTNGRVQRPMRDEPPNHIGRARLSWQPTRRITLRSILQRAQGQVSGKEELRSDRDTVILAMARIRSEVTSRLEIGRAHV